MKQGPFWKGWVNHRMNNIVPLAPIIYDWIDMLWLPFAFFTMERGRKLLTCGFVLSCILLLRLQVELLQQLDHPEGFFHVFESRAFTRGLVSYGVFIAFFLLIARLSPGAMKAVHTAASISILIAAFCVSMFFMVL